jgi:hypothetical protein
LKFVFLAKKNSLLFLAFLLLYGNVTILNVPAFPLGGGSEFHAITLQPPKKNLQSVKEVTQSLQRKVLYQQFVSQVCFKGEKSHGKFGTCVKNNGGSLFLQTQIEISGYLWGLDTFVNDKSALFILVMWKKVNSP